MNINFNCPINQTGYGIASISILKALILQGHNVSCFPIGNPSVSSQEEYNLVIEAIQRSELLDIHAPYLKIWHQFDLSSHIGKGKYYAYPFFELDTFNIREKIHLSVPDCIFVSSSWARNVLISNGIKSEIKIAPLGVDTKIFDYKKFNKSNSKYVFANIGKWEVRKGHDILYDLFAKAFPDQKDVELWILASEITNNYSSPEDLKQWKSLYSRDDRIKLYNGVNNHHDMAHFISQIDCGIFPSRAEGWNLELLECMAMNKPTIATNYSAHTEFCTKDNCFLIDIDEIEKAFDGKAFNGQGNWAKITDKQKDAIIDNMRYCYNNRIIINDNGIKTANNFSWANTANLIHRCMYN